MQLLSDCAGASQHVFTQLLLAPRAERRPAVSLGRGATRGASAGSGSDDILLVPSALSPVMASVPSGPRGGDEDAPPPSKPQIAFLTQPVLGIFGVFSVLIFEHGDFTPPPLGSLMAFALGVTGILLCELRLVELTSALTLAVLAAAHNVIMVIFFLVLGGEGGDISLTQSVGYAVNTAGVVAYAVVKRWQNREDSALQASGVGAALLAHPGDLSMRAGPAPESNLGHRSDFLSTSTATAAKHM
ncbi:unnamed protein product [Prorocentrum cordatum]|uniref:Protein RFT1 homolog n=1 Tax=Prorocentrum cordatum TaxID=2364126 RepID=A0ABN9R8Q1_9DINO|nr:unnamed protein product [Polarella glacialis]